jgi:glycosyltransferase involved in cell wall biosynthesis
MTDRQDSRLSGADTKKIAYIIGSFPDLTTTFIDREILEAKRQGVELVIVSIRRLPQFQMGTEIKRLAEETKYVLPVPWLRFLRINLYFGLTRHWSYLFTLVYLLTRPHPSFFARLKTLLHFGEGVWAAALLRFERVDHIHAHFADRAAIVALVASRLLGVPYSLTAHANDIYVSPVLLGEKINNAKFVTTCTGYNKTHLERATGRPIELVYHGLDLTAITPVAQPTRNDHRPLILSVGQLKEKKGFPHLIKACQWLKLQGYDFKCEIIGEGPDRRNLETLINDLKLQDTVILRGALPNTEVMTRYTQATLFTLPCVIAKNADRDGIPNVLLEAMASQVPVISTRVSGIPEVIKDGVTGLIVAPGDEKALAKAVARLLDNPKLRQALAENGRRQVVENFDIRTNIGRLIELLEM